MYGPGPLAYMRDIAEREAINRFTTAEIKVEQHNENHISKDTDLDGIMDAWANDFAEKLDVSEEGVHEYHSATVVKRPHPPQASTEHPQ